MEEANIDLTISEKAKKACKSASIITFSYNENKYFKWKGPDWFHIIFHYPSQYREIKMIQEIDLHTLIGNVGAYIGLFLGKILNFIDMGVYNFIQI